MKCLLRKRGTDIIFPTLKDLFSNMKIIMRQGKDSSSQSAFYLNWVNFLSNDTYYLFSIYYGNIGVWKIKNRVPVSTPLYLKSDTPYRGGIYVQIINDVIEKVYYRTGQYASGSATSSGTSSFTAVYGGTMFICYFPSYTEEIIDNIFKNSLYYRISGRDTSEYADISTTNKTHQIYIASQYDSVARLDVYVVENNTYIYLNGTRSRASSSTETTITIPSVYGGSIIGMDY